MKTPMRFVSRCSGPLFGTVFFLVLVGACSGAPSEDSRPEIPATAVADAPVELPIPVRVGMTWDEAHPFLSKVERIKNTFETSNRFTDVYRIGGQGYSLQFEAPAQPAAGPYRLIRIARAELGPDPKPIDLNDELRVGTTMGDALPVMQRVGGHFIIETRDRFVAVLGREGGSYRITFERPSGVSRPDLIADMTPSDIAIAGRIPLNMLPEFSAYRITAVKKDG